VEVDTPSERGETALGQAAAAGNVMALRFLLAHGAATDRRGPKGKTPLVAACTHGHASVVEALLEAGARPDGPADGHVCDCAIAMALERSHLAVAARLAGAGARLPRTHGCRALVGALRLKAALPQRAVRWDSSALGGEGALLGEGECAEALALAAAEGEPPDGLLVVLRQVVDRNAPRQCAGWPVTELEQWLRLYGPRISRASPLAAAAAVAARGATDAAVLTAAAAEVGLAMAEAEAAAEALRPALQPDALPFGQVATKDDSSDDSADDGSEGGEASDRESAAASSPRGSEAAAGSIAGSESSEVSTVGAGRLSVLRKGTSFLLAQRRRAAARETEAAAARLLAARRTGTGGVDEGAAAEVVVAADAKEGASAFARYTQYTAAVAGKVKAVERATERAEQEKWAAAALVGRMVRVTADVKVSCLVAAACPTRR
jgi:hypothetical protein